MPLVPACWVYSGADPGFQLRRAEGGAKIFGVFRVKNYDFTPRNHIFSNFREGARRVRSPPESPPIQILKQSLK